MTRQLTKLRGSSTPAAAPSGNGRWERPQMPLFKLPSTASSPVHAAAAPATSHNLQALVSENELLKQQIESLQTSFEELNQRAARSQVEFSCSAGAAPVSAQSSSVAVETERSSKYFTEEMFRIFNVSDHDACCRVAQATLQLAKAVPHLQSLADDVSDMVRQVDPQAALDTPGQIMHALRRRLAELPTVHSSDTSRGTRQQLEQRSGLAVVSVVHTAPADESKGAAHSGAALDGSNAVFFTAPQSEDSLATSPLLPPPAAAASLPQHDNPARQGDAPCAAVLQAMSLLGCRRQEDLVVCVEHLLVQSDELQHLRAVLSRRLDLSDPCAAFVDAELSSRHVQYAAAADSDGCSSCIKLQDPFPDEALSLPAAAGAAEQQHAHALLDAPAASMQHSLAWDIVMHPARRPKPNLSANRVAARAPHGQPKQPRPRDLPRRTSSQSKLQQPQHADAGFSQLLFANFKRRLLAQHSSATAELLSASRQLKPACGKSSM
jgi:cell division septum initiation protein DivIVA